MDSKTLPWKKRSHKVGGVIQGCSGDTPKIAFENVKPLILYYMISILTLQIMFNHVLQPHCIWYYIIFTFVQLLVLQKTVAAIPFVGHGQPQNLKQKH